MDPAVSSPTWNCGIAAGPAQIAGRRWTVEESFQAGKGLAGLDEHQIRRWTSWRRWTPFAMLAPALLAVIAANGTSPHRSLQYMHEV